MVITQILKSKIVTRKKLQFLKCPNIIYRTNCDLLIISIIIVQILLVLITYINCSSEFFNSYNNNTEYSIIQYNLSLHNNNKNNNTRLIDLTDKKFDSARRKITNFNNGLDFYNDVIHGLGLHSLPDVSKMNISQTEYETKYNEYLNLARMRKIRELLQQKNMDYLVEVAYPKRLFSFVNNSSAQYTTRLLSKRRVKRSFSNSELIYLRFPINMENDIPADIEEASLRLLVILKGVQHINDVNQNSILTIKVYQLLEPYNRVWLDSRTIHLNDLYKSSSQWLEFDVTKCVVSWLMGQRKNLGLEVHCDGCHRYGASVVYDAASDISHEESTPILNIVGRLGIHREKRSRQHHHLMPAAKRKARKTDCYKENQKCCRHTMDVVFKEIKGFEFIIQPKVFDAGYCKGKCPPRYNPAHHHALLQSLIWKQDKSKAPRPCCAPSKLVELEVLHVDENDSKKLKVSTWSDMRVLECACS